MPWTYEERKKGAAVIVVPESKVCTKCGVDKPAAEFYRNKQHRNGLASACRKCSSTAASASRRKRLERDPSERVKENRRTRISKFWMRYGLTEEEFLAMSDFCEMCGDTENLHIDHCHKTNRVRGRLCRSCNLMLGYAEDDPERLKLGIAYLERTSHASD